MSTEAHWAPPPPPPPLQPGTERARLPRIVPALAVLVGFFLFAVSVTALFNVEADTELLTEVTDFGSNPGNSRMFIYVPEDLQPGAALVVLPNPAGTTHRDYDDEFGWLELADRWQNIALVFDEHTANGNFCAVATDSRNDRDGTEMTSTMQMIDYMERTYGVDPDQTFMTGLSCGAIWSYYAAASNPDTIEAVAGVSGTPYRCPDGEDGAGNDCLEHARDRTPEDWGDMAREQNPGYDGPWPRVSVWHGEGDFVLPSGWRTEVVDQFTDLHGIDQEPDGSRQVRRFTVTSYADDSGEIRVEEWSNPDLGHQYPVAPGDAFDRCGESGTTAADVGVCGAYEMAAWFGINPDR